MADAKPAHGDFGNDYSRFFGRAPEPDDPFPNPANDGQRVINARSRAAKAGIRINSGYLNPKTGILEDPDRGFGRWMGNNPELMAAAVIGGGLAGGAIGGGAAAASGGTTGAGTVGMGAGEVSLASSALPAGSVGTGVTGAVAGGGTAGGGGGGGVLSSLLGGNKATLARGAGQALGAASQGMAHNRGEKFGAQLDMERLVMDRDRDFYDRQVGREQENRAGTTDAWRKLLSTQHVLSPGPRPQLSKYSVAPRQATEQERMGATALSDEVLARLQGGNPIPQQTQRPMQVDPKLLNAGGWEKAMGIASPLLGLLGRWGK